MSTYHNTLAFAHAQDVADPLRAFRDEFHFPQHDGAPVIYFTGNSLGLQPKAAAAALQQELDDWARYGVEGHFLAKHPWYSYHEELTASTARIVGALPEEVVVMNQLTSNLHFLLVSLLSPAGKAREDPHRDPSLSRVTRTPSLHRSPSMAVIRRPIWWKCSPVPVSTPCAPRTSWRRSTSWAMSWRWSVSAA